MPDLNEDDLILRYGVANAMYPLSGMIFAPLFGWLETAGAKKKHGKKERRNGIVMKIGLTSTLAFFIGNILYASVSSISANQDIRFSIIIISRVIAGVASGK